MATLSVLKFNDPYGADRVLREFSAGVAFRCA